MERNEYYQALMQCVRFDRETEEDVCEKCPLRDQDQCVQILMREIDRRYIFGDQEEQAQKQTQPVRCVNCKHYKPESEMAKASTNFKGYWYCENFDRCMSAAEYDPAAFYCSEGEAKEA